MMFREKITKFYAFALAAVFAVALAGCGGGGGTAQEPAVEPTPQEQCAAAGNHWSDGACLTPAAYTVKQAMAAIAAATTAAEAQAAYDAVKADVSAADGETLQAAVNARVAALATMARVEAQKMALMTAAGNIDTSDLSTAEKIAAANTAIAALQAALDAADDVSDADKAMYQSQLMTARNAVATAQTGLDTRGRMAAQRTAISNAVAAARAAVGEVDNDSSAAEVMAADDAIAALQAAIDGAADLPEGDSDVASAQGTLATLQGTLASAKTARQAALDTAADKANKEAIATAMKLYNGISAPTAVDASPEASRRHATYSGTNDSEITVTNGATSQALKADKATVAAHHGWQGKRYTASGTGVTGTYEAVVYSNVGKPTEGAKFSATYPYNAREVSGSNTELTINTGTTEVQKRIASSSFDQSAGKKEFKLPDNTERVVLSGTYHGVSGTYYCDPSSGETCSATVVDGGFTLGNGTWTFKATNKDARLMDTPDPNFESYGWWLHKSADGKTFTASAFTDNKGADRAEVSISELRGTATYVGGAAGKYAISNPTGSPNDAGHFTARATLKATFAADHKISGTIDNFMAGGESKNWSVKLNETDISDSGVIDGVGGDENNVEAGTVWTIGGTDAPKSGQWRGSLQEEKNDVPTVGTGTFYSEFNRSGRMVGGFGVNKQ